MELVTTNQRQVANRATVDEQLPGWIQYLIGAYPQQKPNKMTFAVMESQFEEYSNGIMLQAVKEYVKNNQYWPSVSELSKYIKEPQEGHLIPFHIWHNRIYAPKNWQECGDCGELSPDLDDCPFCKDIELHLTQGDKHEQKRQYRQGW